MANTSYLKYHKRELEDNINDLNSLLISLQNSINELKVIKQNIKKGYELNEVSGDNNYINTIIEKEQSLYNDITNTVIPVTRQKISYLKDQIQQQEEAEAAEAAEEENNN